MVAPTMLAPLWKAFERLRNEPAKGFWPRWRIGLAFAPRIDRCQLIPWHAYRQWHGIEPRSPSRSLRYIFHFRISNVGKVGGPLPRGNSNKGAEKG